MKDVDIKGINEVIKNMENYGKSNLKKPIDNSLKKGGDYAVSKLKDILTPYKKTGATANEVVRSNPQSSNNYPEIQVGWNGPKDRWRLIHLNEFGYNRAGRKIKPAMYGLIQKTTIDIREHYFSIIQEELKNNL